MPSANAFVKAGHLIYHLVVVHFDAGWSLEGDLMSMLCSGEELKTGTLACSNDVVESRP